MHFKKKQRIELYKKAVLKFEEAIAINEYSNMCFCILLSILGWGNYGKSPIISDPTIEFPELEAFRPKGIDSEGCVEWFPVDKKGTRKRIKILQTIIKDYEKHL